MDTAQKKLILLTELYPAKNADTFFNHDYALLAKAYQRVIVYPLSQKTDLLDHLPDNMTVNSPLMQQEKAVQKNLLLNTVIFLKIILSELRYGRKKINFIKRLRYHLAEIKTAIRLETDLHQILLNEDKAALTFHASFMNIHALVLAIAKEKKHINSFSFRINGYEIFEDQWIGGYLPYEDFIYKRANAIIANSKQALAHKKKRGRFSKKIHYCYYSMNKNPLGPIPQNSQKFTLVSCASVIPVKRIDLIAKALHLVPQNIHWIHFGGGTEMNTLQKNCNTLPSNITANLKGKVANTDIIDFYQTTPVDLFIHVSSSEGLCYALMEAQSFGIPTMACASGGVIDFVNNDRGKLLPLDIEPAALAAEITAFLESEKNNLSDRKYIQDEFQKQFDNGTILEKQIKLLEG